MRRRTFLLGLVGLVFGLRARASRARKRRDVHITVPALTAHVYIGRATLPGPPPAAAVDDLATGFAHGSMIAAASSADQTADFNKVAAMGGSWSRIDCDWSIVQAGGSTAHNWTNLDAMVTKAKAAGLKLMLCIDYTPSWARAGGLSKFDPPTDVTDYANFAADVVARYKTGGVLGLTDGVDAYEVWNEPNSDFFWRPTSNPVIYTAMLIEAYAAMKAEDADAYVIAGSTAPASTNGSDYSPIDFLSNIYSNGGGDSFDGWSHHPYSWPFYPDGGAGDVTEGNAWGQMEDTATSIRSVMIANGDSAKKIWADECGAPTNGSGALGTDFITENNQASMAVMTLMVWAQKPWGAGLTWYSLRDKDTVNGSATRENAFGVIETDRTDKPARVPWQTCAEAILAGPRTPPGSVTPLIWYAADQMPFVDTGIVPGLVDLSASAINVRAENAQAARRPICKTNIINGKRVFRFDGTDDVLSSASGAINFDTQFTAIFVAKVTAPAVVDHQGLMRLESGAGDNASLVLRRNAAGNRLSFWDHANLWKESSLSPVQDQFYIISFRWIELGALEIYVDSTQVLATTSALATTPWTKFHVGSSGGRTNQFLTGDIAEVLLYGTALSSGSRAAVESALKTKYGIA